MDAVVSFYIQTVAEIIGVLIVLISSSATVYTLSAKKKFPLRVLNNSRLLNRSVILKPFIFSWSVVIFVCSLWFICSNVYPSLLDVGLAHVSNYSTSKGYVVQCNVTQGRKTDTDLFIQDEQTNVVLEIDFSNRLLYNINTGDKVVVQYLPNTGYGLTATLDTSSNNN